eukprot:m.122205 g.122205  ORF g.122205 m.122205 type:complete len:1330 (+) comp16553_c0_seq4:198-4187(+)
MASTEAASSTVCFFVNGRKVVDDSVDPEDTLLHYLRTKLRLTGTKLGCGEGGCGACTVLLSHYDRREKKIVHRSVNACLTPVCSVDGCAIITVEGIGSSKTRLHAVQERIAKTHGSQCGFCTPGIVMSMYALLRNNNNPSEQQIEDAFDGNLCRCTGYRPILSGFKTFASNVGKPAGCDGSGRCAGCPGAADTSVVEQHQPDASEFTPYDPTQEPIFPPELLLKRDEPVPSLAVVGPRTTWHRPTTLERLLELKRDCPDARIIVGNTEVGVEVKFKASRFPMLIDPLCVDELTAITVEDDGVYLGSAVTLQRIQHSFRELLTTLPEFATGNITAVLEMLQWFAGNQIRNAACVGGNVATASPISDLNPVWVASGATFTVQSLTGGARTIAARDFFLAYRKTAMSPDEVLVKLWVPHTRENEYVEAFKQARRQDDDIAIVNSCMRVHLSPEDASVLDVGISFGGLAPTTISAKNVEQLLKGKPFVRSVFDPVCAALQKDAPLPPEVPGGMVEYRQCLAASFFFKFMLMVLRKVDASALDQRELSATERPERPLTTSVQRYEEPLVGAGGVDTVGQPVAHLSAFKQASGEAQYTDDLPLLQSELYGALVLSRHAHANLISVTADKALEIPGVVAFFGADDVPGTNAMGPIAKDEECFASKKVTCVGAVIGIVVGETQRAAQEGARAVQVEYEVLPPIVTIEQAIEAKSWYTDKIMKRGDVDAAFETVDQIVEGEVRVGGQEHFYLETQASVCVPKGEDGEMEIFASTQATHKTQMMVASVLGVPANRIVCRVKRLGGGFGGKETRSVFLTTAVAVAASNLGRPVRCMLDRDEDMCTTGGRHPFLARYKVGVDNSGRVKALDISLFSNAGNSLDLSEAVMDRALYHLDNCYNIEHVRGRGVTCKTNLPSNTAFRGFGGPQAMIIAESWMDHVARVCNIRPERLRELNFYSEGEKTHFGQPLVDCQIQAVWQEAKRTSKFVDRCAEVEAFNKENRFHKRGIAMVPTKFGISFTAFFMNQAGALVHVYTDGSVMVTHGGTEMGQGLYTKMCQVAARALGVPLSQVYTSESSTATVPNASPTAASASSDLYGMAVYNACQQIMSRLKPFKLAAPEKSFNDWVTAAYFDRVSLSATGFYKTPDLSFDWETCTGTPFNYFCYGAACAEVEIDVLTGHHEVRRVDICMDVGASLNPAIDIGQVEGGFVQGMGLCTLEEMVYSPEGVTFSRGPGAYKLPGFKCIPVELNVSLLRNAPNVRAVHSSKAVGEPPFFLGSSVMFAIKDAIVSARKEDTQNGSSVFRFDSPATAERIRLACTDTILRQIPQVPADAKRWNVVV